MAISVFSYLYDPVLKNIGCFFWIGVLLCVLCFPQIAQIKYQPNHPPTHTHTHAGFHTHTHTHTHAGFHTHTHTHAEFHTHTHTHTHAEFRVLSSVGSERRLDRAEVGSSSLPTPT